MMNMVKRLIKEEEGQGMAEYALILVAVALICIFGYRLLGNNVNNLVSGIKFN